MTSKIFRSTLLVAGVVLLCSFGVIIGVLYRHFTQVQVAQLKDELSLAVTGTEQYGNAFLENVEASRFRITWIDTDGTVLMDTWADQTAMENHADREEIRQAFETGYGSAVRTSATLTEQTYYEARRLADGTVLRVSANQQAAWFLMFGLLWPIAVIAAIAMILSAVLARRMARKIVEPLNRLDLEQPLKNMVYDELSPLLRRIHRQHNQIAAHMEQLRHKADEFQQITGSMQDGLVVISSEGIVLSINPAAQRVFEAKETCIGKHFLSVDRSAAIRDAVNDALDKGHGHARMNRNGRDYQLELSRIESDREIIGAVVLIFDITEQLYTEKIRREFSANVSHELKTPLQGIIGSAELLESGLVKSEDVPRFVGHIRKEASRLVDLINDIIRLSQLDEGAVMPAESVDLLQICREVQETLTPSAAKKNVTISVCGEGFSLSGVRRMLQELVYNLCDNAIRYNVPGGSVRITVGNRQIRVQDTGIGIPAEHQSRVFERFYRVDKSHSKQTGGTGLGLSIVKHAAAYHNAAIDLQSTPGQGTTVTIQF
jgi:two-component system phosphate regulon sensor histidine kinase PhoR